MGKYFAYYITFSLIMIINGNPSCRTSGYTDIDETILTCTPTNNEDNVISSGLMLGNNYTRIAIFQGCNLVNIELLAFQNMRNLVYIDLAINKFTDVDDINLDYISRLKVLNLSYNFLTEIPNKFFSRKRDIVALDLSYNNIKLQSKIFHSLMNLQLLNLSNNSIIGRNIASDILENNIHLVVLSLSNNYMDGAPSNLLDKCKILRALFLENCFLSDVPKFATRKNLRTLRTLSLSNNNIIRLQDPTTFKNLDNLLFLDLGKNDIEYINGDIFQPLKMLGSLRIQENKLTILPATLFHYSKNLMDLDLSYNQISMIPVESFKGTLLKYLNIANNRITYLSDNFCQNLIASGIPLKSFYFDQNPWQCTCLQNLLDEVKLYELSYNSMAYNGKHPVCVTKYDLSCKRHPIFNDVYIKMYDDLNLDKHRSMQQAYVKYVEDISFHIDI